MKLHVLYFAAAKDAAGTASEALEFPAGTTAASLLQSLAERHARLQKLLPQVRLAVNEEFAAPTQALNDGDTVALIPPVAGG